jgi:flagellar biosynthesis GTPase FlhF
MKLTTSILVIMLAASASAQQKPADQPAPVKSGTVNMAPAKPTAATQTKTTTAPAKAAPAPAKVAPAQKPEAAAKAPAPQPKKAPVAAKSVAKKAPKEAAKEAPKVEAKEEKAEPEMEKSKRVAAFDRTKRDPFQTIVREHAAAGGACQGGGKQCLVPDEVALKGIVRSNGAIIAVVTTKDNRAYFLRENDPVLNGVVTRISEGSITFREKTTDIFGKTVMREVVKKINPTAA